ncbi:MAG: nucleotidyl transferase AbiEii/AbiGii toxin family protein [Candidatus Diapherotrites archaeon]|nr:nucleotidyl transferase AbiEii/AbiGii toxin family protein [Candidatus Diapherotrites archaeon]
MAYTRKKTIKGHEYAYMVKSVRTPKGPRQKVVEYLGAAQSGVLGAGRLGGVRFGTGFSVPADEVRALAREQGASLGMAEKDFMLSVFLKYLYLVPGSEVLVFKGGTALSKVYVKGYRLSEDLDFTAMIKDKKAVRELLRRAARELGFVIKRENMTSRSYTIRLGFVGMLMTPNSIHIDVDFTRTPVLKPKHVKKKLPYKGLGYATMVVYDLRELFAEKVMALSHRKKPRDFYDIWYLFKHKRFNRSEIAKIVKAKGREFPPGLDVPGIFSGTDAARRQWKNRLVELMHDVPDFDVVLAELRPKLEALEKAK